MKKILTTLSIILISFACTFADTYTAPDGNFTVYGDYYNDSRYDTIDVDGANYIRLNITINASCELGETIDAYLSYEDGDNGSDYYNAWQGPDGSSQTVNQTVYLKNPINLDFYTDVYTTQGGSTFTISYEAAANGEVALSEGSFWAFAEEDHIFYLGEHLGSGALSTDKAFTFTANSTNNVFDLWPESSITASDNNLSFAQDNGLLTLDKYGALVLGGSNGQAGLMDHAQFEISGSSAWSNNYSGTKLLITNYRSEYVSGYRKTVYPIKIKDRNGTTDFHIKNKNENRSKTEMYFSGKFGLGVSNPAKMLEVAGDINFNGNLYRNNTLIDFTDISLSGGKLGVGVSAIPSDATLAVGGKIYAEEVIIKYESQWWPDYVFGDSYQIGSLYDLETYVNKHKHLPGIPSARSIGEEGISIAEMNKQLLQKVEELTLYMIQLKKENDALRDDMDQLLRNHR